MIRRTTAVALVLSAVPAALALTLFTGTAQADDTPWSSGSSVARDTPWVQRISNDTPWGTPDTPWRHSPKPANGAHPQGDDTPWA